MPVISQEKIEARREAIVDAAEALIAESGLSSVSARSVAKRADCSTSLIYLHFKDFDEVVLRANSRFIARLDAALAAGAASQSVADRYVELALVYLRFGLANRPQWSALFEHRMADGRPLPEWHLEEHLRLFRHISEPLGKLLPDMGLDDRNRLARTIYSAVHGIVSLSIERRLGEVPVTELEGQIELVVRAMVGGLPSAVHR